MSTDTPTSSRWNVGVVGIAFVALFLASTFAGGSDLGGPDQPVDVVAQDLAENRLDGLRFSARLIGLSADAVYRFIGGLCKRLWANSSSGAV